ncbi:MAG: TlpA disulfide reductase family protein [Limnobacter sp.]|nr:TlpA disulfide reductase family protein [Limnobacter sp.]
MNTLHKIIFGLAAVAAIAFGLFFNLNSEESQAGGYPLQGYVFETPDGTTLDLGALQGRMTVVNFWATWCPPCVEEMPELDELYQHELRPAGIELIGVAVDRKENVDEFLQSTPVNYPIVLTGFEGTQLAKNLGNSQGGLPFTVVLDEEGNVLLKKAGRIQMDTLRNALPASR